PATGTPSGVVKFYDGTTLIGSGTLDSSGDCSISTTVLARGTHQIVAAYGGNANLPMSTGKTTHAVNKAATTASVNSSPNPSVFGETVTISGAVNVTSPGAGTPSGTFDFYIDTVLVGTAP